MRKWEIINWLEQPSEIVGYSSMADYTGHRIASSKTMLIIKISTLHLPDILRISVQGKNQSKAVNTVYLFWSLSI